MNSRIAMLGLITLGVTGVYGTQARAQSHAGSQDLQIYAGEMFGDRITETPLSGKFPLLDDAAVFGGRYTYDFTDQWGIQLSAGYSPSRAAHVVAGGSDLGLTTVDLDVLWNVVPELTFRGHAVVPYTEVGVGYAWSDLNHTLNGFVGTTPVALHDSNGYTANAGIGVKYYLTSSVFVDFDARYRYLSRIVSRDAQGSNTAETSLSLGYQF